MSIIVNPLVSASARDLTWLVAMLGRLSGNRTDLAAMTADFVMLAEKRLSADLESRMQEMTATLSATTGGAQVDLPADLAEIRALSIPAVAELDYLTPNQYNTAYINSAPGRPRNFSVIGQQLALGPVPDTAYSLTLVYRAYLPALAESGGSNWLITLHPNCYLAAAMCELLTYTKNQAELPLWEKKYADAIESVNKPDWFSGSTLRVRADVRSV